jgi:hypothetical protein
VTRPRRAPLPRPQTVSLRVDRAGRISILKHRYRVGRHLTGEAVTIESAEGLLHVTHNGGVVATHARRHLIEDDDKMNRRSQAARPARPTKGAEVHRIVDRSEGISFAGTGYRVSNRFIGSTVGVRLVDDTVQKPTSRSCISTRVNRAARFRSRQTAHLESSS